MNDVMILRRGGGGKTGLPAIYVDYPPGSVCTCSNNNGKTYTAKDNSGLWLFSGLELGTWTVTATDGTNSKSQSVSITKEGQFESVELSYRYYLFNNGSVVAWTPEARREDAGDVCTVGSTIYGKATASTGYRSAVAYTDVIDISKYSKLCVNFTAITAEAYFGLITSAVAGGNDVDAINNWSASQKVTSKGTKELDISSFASATDLCVIVGTYRDGDYIRSFEADQVWLE